MRRESLASDEIAADKMVVAAALTLLMISAVSVIVLLSTDEGENPASSDWEWVDPITEVEDDNHSHTDLLSHRLSTPNMQLIDYHNLNCDGEMFPPPELDNTAGRPCDSEMKNTAPTPGDNSEVIIEGNFHEGCVIHGDGSG